MEIYVVKKAHWNEDRKTLYKFDVKAFADEEEAIDYAYELSLNSKSVMYTVDTLELEM